MSKKSGGISKIVSPVKSMIFEQFGPIWLLSEVPDHYFYSGKLIDMLEILYLRRPSHKIIEIPKESGGILKKRKLTEKVSHSGPAV